MKLVLEAGADPDLVDDHASASALHYAATANSVQAVRLLLEAAGAGLDFVWAGISLETT